MTQETTTRIALAAGAAAVAVGLGLLGSVLAASEARPPVAPPLDETAARCKPGADPELRARTLRAAAEARLERRVFAPRDGVDALSLLSEAVACNDDAHDSSASAANREELRRRQQQLDADYRQRRTRLGHALETGRSEDARVESRGLLALLAGRDDAYTTWLRRIEQSAP